MSPSWLNQLGPKVARWGELGRHAAGALRGIARRAREETPLPRLRHELAVMDDHPAAREHGFRPAHDLAALVRRVAGAILHAGGRERHAFVRVPDGDVGVGADRDRAL